MSVVDERREVEASAGKRGSVAHQVSLGFDRRVLVAHPGSEAGFSVQINGPPRHIVGVKVRGIPASVAEVLISPSKSVAPYTSEVSLTVSEGAVSGMYPFYVVIHDHTRGQSIGVEKLGLLILPRELTLRHYVEARRIYHYEELGAQGVLWYLVARVHGNGASFTELKRAYELVRGGPVRNATIAKILKCMTRKGLIRKGEDGRYYPLVTRPEIAFSRINRSRVRI